MHETLPAHLLESLELGQRVGMIVDAQIERRIVLGGVDAKRCRLLAALVAAHRLAGLQGPDQAAGKGQIGAIEIDASGLGNHLRAGQHIAGDRKSVMDDLAAPGDALGAGMRGDCAARVLQMDLARLAAGIGGEQQVHHDLRRHALAQQAQAACAKGGIDQGLGGQCTDAAVGMGAERADRKKPRGDRHTKGTRKRVTRNDRPGHGSTGQELERNQDTATQQAVSDFESGASAKCPCNLRRRIEQSSEARRKRISGAGRCACNQRRPRSMR